MARRIPARGMLRLGASGPSATVMARTRPVSKTSVIDAFHAADERGVAREGVEGTPDAEAYAPLFPERAHEGPVCRDPDRDRVHRELARVGVTLRRPHEEYRDGAGSKGEPFVSYDRLRERYRELTARKQVRAGSGTGPAGSWRSAGRGRRCGSPAPRRARSPRPACSWPACPSAGRPTSSRRWTWGRTHGSAATRTRSPAPAARRPASRPTA